MGQEVLVTVGQPSSALPLSRHSPGPASACLAVWSQTAATVDIGLKSIPGLHLRPGRARLQDCEAKGTPGICALPTPALPTHQEGEA